MNKNLRLFGLRLLVGGMVCVMQILNLSANDSPEIPASFVQVDRLPEDVLILTEKFFEIINNDQLWKLGALKRPDLPEDQAIEIYLKSNPYLADQRDAKVALKFGGVKQTPWVPLQFWQFGNDAWIVKYRTQSVVVSFVSTGAAGEGEWIVRYGTREIPDKTSNLPFLLWIKEKDTWRLAGFGWSIETVKEQLKKEFAH